MTLFKSVDGERIALSAGEEDATRTEWVKNALPPTSAELDALAAKAAAEFMDNDAKIKALGMVIADLVEAQFGLNKAQARARVRSRFQDYYRQLLD